MDIKKRKYGKSGRETKLDRYVKNFIKTYQKDVMDKNTFLSFMIYDSLCERRTKPLIGDKNWPYLHARLEVPTRDVAKQVKKLFDVDFYELSLHMDAKSPMYSAYCSLLENSKLVNRFITKNKGLVKLDRASELESLLKDAGVKPEIDGVKTIKTAFGIYGKIIKKNKKGNLIPVRYKEVPVGEFFAIIDNIEGLELLDNDSEDFCCELRDKPDYKKVLRNYTTKLVLSIFHDAKNKKNRSA